MNNTFLIKIRFTSFLVIISLFLINFPGSTSLASSSPVDLYISEYIEGSSYNKALEIYNGTGSTVDLAAGNYDVQMYFNGNSSAGLTIPLSGAVSDADVFVLARDTADSTILEQADQTSGASWFNGNDAVVLRKDSVIIDTVGQVGYNPGTEWGVGDQSTGDNTLRRKEYICQGDSDASNTFDPTLEWDGYPQNTFDGLGTHTAVCGASLIINEVDADQADTDDAEFIELFDRGVGNSSLDGMVLVLYNGEGDVSYATFDLDGNTTDSNGHFVLCGNIEIVPNCDLDVSPDSDLIQNGADAIGLYEASATDFPNGTPITITNLLDALVYDTSDTDDEGLLILLNPGQPQVDENGKGDKDGHSNQRCPNGSGGVRNTDTYDQFTPTPGEGNICPTGPDFGACGDPATFVHTIQSDAASSPETGNTHIIEGVVVGDFQDITTGLSGFFLQEEDSHVDTNPLTSEGIFINDNGFGVDVNIRDLVRVKGDVNEYFELTELNNISNMAVCGTESATPASISLPVSNMAVWENYEGMLVSINQTLYVTGNYTQGRYGEVDLSINYRLFNPTNVVNPGTAALELQDMNDRSRIQLDDGSRIENPLPLPPYLGDSDTLRAGDTIPVLNGVLSYSFENYEIHPTLPVTFTRINSRTDAPPVSDGNLKVASFNVLNYFTTIDTGAAICGPSGNMDCRGADSTEEFTRQRDKIISALVAMDADVVGLVEIENNATAAVQDLVDGLNDVMDEEVYAFIDTGTIGTDAIKVALIYKPASVSPLGSYAILDSNVDTTFIDTKNRPVLAQTFIDGSDQKFTVAVNHLKSKGSSCASIGDPDIGDGQGNCNLTRTSAAIALVNWLATDPTGSEDDDFLITGDLNAYAMEDPITAIRNAGYIDLVHAFSGAEAYSYTYYGQFGYLDHSLSSPSMTLQVVGTAVWHINADEPSALDYNEFNQPELYKPDQYRASDHDPVLVYLALTPIQRLYLPLVLAK